MTFSLPQLLEQVRARALPGREAAARNEAMRALRLADNELGRLPSLMRRLTQTRPGVSTPHP
jgi:hypothetical protein